MKFGIPFNLVSIICICSLLSCGSSREEQESKALRGYAMDSIVGNTQGGFVSSTAAGPSKDTSKKFIRTADLKFKVKDVRTASLHIENIVALNKGYVTYTNLVSHINNIVTTSISADSSLETTYYTVDNDIVVRVPNQQLDTTIRTIAKLIEFLDYRTIKADDVTLLYLSNKITQRRMNAHSQRLKEAIDEKGKKLSETTIAEENLVNKQIISDDAGISNLNIDDQVSYSTIKINIYQRQSIRRELIPNNKNIEEYKPGFLYDLKESLHVGFKILTDIFLFFVKIWPLYLLGFLGYFIYNKLKK